MTDNARTGGAHTLRTWGVAPLVLGKAVALHPLLILFGISAGFVSGGIVEAFVTVPFLAIITDVTRTLRPELLRTEPEP